MFSLALEVSLDVFDCFVATFGLFVANRFFYEVRQAPSHINTQHKDNVGASDAIRTLNGFCLHVGRVACSEHVLSDFALVLGHDGLVRDRGLVKLSSAIVEVINPTAHQQRAVVYERGRDNALIQNVVGVVLLNPLHLIGFVDLGDVIGQGALVRLNHLWRQAINAHRHNYKGFPVGKLDSDQFLSCVIAAFDFHLGATGHRLLNEGQGFSF